MRPSRIAAGVTLVGLLAAGPVYHMYNLFKLDRAQQAYIRTLESHLSTYPDTIFRILKLEEAIDHLRGSKAGLNASYVDASTRFLYRSDKDDPDIKRASYYLQEAFSSLQGGSVETDEPSTQSRVKYIRKLIKELNEGLETSPPDRSHTYFDEFYKTRISRTNYLMSLIRHEIGQSESMLPPAIASEVMSKRVQR